MIEVQVDDLLQDGEVILHLDCIEDEKLISFVKDIRRGDRETAKLAIVNNPELTMIMKQVYIDQGKMKIFRLSREDDPEYFL